MKCAPTIIILIFALVGCCAAQAIDISAIAQAGSVTENKYENSFLKLVVDAPNATLQLNPLVNKMGGRARLVQIFSKQTAWEDNYTLAVLADTLAKYPQLQSPAHYVRSVRHQLEKEGLPTVREEFPVAISGVQFTGAILQEQVPNGRKYYRGLYTAFRNGIILSFDAEAPSEEKLTELLTRVVKLGKL